MRLLPVVALLFGAAEVANAQATIRGHVRNARTNEPVAGATVLVVDLRIGAVTDSGGTYEIAGVPARVARRKGTSSR